MKVSAYLCSRAAAAAIVFISLFSGQLRAQDTTIFYEPFIESDPNGAPLNWEVNLAGNYWYIDSSIPIQSETPESNAMYWGSGAQDSASMISPVIDCRTHPNVIAQFYDILYPGSSPSPRLFSVSGDSGKTWTLVFRDSLGDGDSHFRRFNISDIAGGKQYVRLKFTYVDRTGYAWAVDDVRLFASGIMAVTSVKVFQKDFVGLWPGDTVKQVMGVKIATSGAYSPLTISSATFTTSGCSDPADIAKARLYVSTVNSFSTTTQIGNIVTSPDGAFTFQLSSPYTITSDSTFLWLAYDISSVPTGGNLIDASLTSVTVGGLDRYPAIFDTVGAHGIWVEHTYDSVRAQVAGVLPRHPGTEKNPTIKVRVYLGAPYTHWFKVLKMHFNTHTTTNTADVTRARLFYQGQSTSNTPDTTAEAAEPVINPNGSFTFTVNRSFKTDSVYAFFLVTYDIASNAGDLDTLRTALDSVQVTKSKTLIPFFKGGTWSNIIYQYLTGTKTIGTGKNYSTINAAVTDLNLRYAGQGGVIFDIDGMDFNELPFTINSAVGKADSPVLFRKSPSAGRNPALVVPAGNTGNFVIRLNGCDYVTIDGLDISAAASSILAGYQIVNALPTDGAQHNTISNCTITMQPTAYYGMQQSLNYTPTSLAGANSYNRYYNCTIMQAYNGINVIGNAVYPDVGIEIGGINGGTFRVGTASAPMSAPSNYEMGIYLQGCRDVNVFSTEVQNIAGTGSASVFGLWLDNVFGSNRVYNNKVHDLRIADTAAASGWVYGIIVSNASMTGADTNFIYNNAVYGIKHARKQPVWNLQCVGLMLNCQYYGLNRIVHNSIQIDSSSGVTSIAFRDLKGNVLLKNNILANRSDTASVTERYAIWTDNTSYSGTKIYDYNDYYLPSAATNYIGYYYNQKKQDLVNWRSYTSQDAHSYSVNPGFVSAGNLHIDSMRTRTALYGTPVGVTADLDGLPRSLTQPYLGAYEYTGPIFCSGAVRFLIEGFYNTGLNRMSMADTVTVKLHSASAPYTVVDSQRVVFDTDGNVDVAFPHASEDGTYYLSIHHRNSLETWSAVPRGFSNKRINYDFTDAKSQAYGENLVLLGSKYCMYSGDVNQDGIIDFSDIMLVDNDSYALVGGYAATDVTGNMLVDTTDMQIVYNNSTNFIMRMRPVDSPRPALQNTITQPAVKVK